MPQVFCIIRIIIHGMRLLVKKCTVCDEELESKEYMIELSTSQRNAVLKVYQEVKNWHCGRDF